MHTLFKFIGLSAISFGVLGMYMPGANAADARGRTAADNANVHTRAGTTVAVSAARMPTMPVMPLNNLGNVMNNMPPANVPNVPDVPDVPDNPGEPDKPDEPDIPDTPTPECPDGGVKDSTYTIENCMDDILQCVNTGALSGGLNDLFNEDLRNAIVNGMALCSAQVDKCVTDVRRDCANVYRSPADVWIDFNTRRVQPAYYNFVLRRTGLTPNQAENTCMLLDRNTYGSSFNAVSNAGNVTAEYNNTVGAYNSQLSDTLAKDNPMGVTVNSSDDTVDGARGHYARWDATTAQCYIRVAAYNKDTQITNSWLFGAAGTDEPAQVWKMAGDTFTCNKELFGFSLMNQTNTAAVVGVTGGAVLGVGIGAAVGAAQTDCDNRAFRRKLTDALTGQNIVTLNSYLKEPIVIMGDVMSKEQCNAFVNLYNDYIQAKNSSITSSSEICATSGSCIFATESEIVVPLADVCLDAGDDAARIKECIIANPEYELCEQVNAFDRAGCEVVLANYTKQVILNKAFLDVACSSEACLDSQKIRVAADIERLDTMFAKLPLYETNNKMGKSIGIGAAVGAGAGGLATAITAFVESNNISCRVGDGLAAVGLGKSYSIGSLKDFYVKWNLQVPDTVSPTALVTDCNSWKQICAMYKDLNHCAAAQINYKPLGAATVTLIPSACRVSGSICVENYPVAKSYGACK